MTYYIVVEDNNSAGKEKITEIDYYYTNAIITFFGEQERIKTIYADPYKSAFWILISGIILFVMFGCIMLSLFLKYKKLYILFSIIMFIAIISIIVLLHVDAYPKLSKYRKFMTELIKEQLINLNLNSVINFKTTETSGYILTLTTLILTGFTVISSVFVL
jgi:hypothetical protein